MSLRCAKNTSSNKPRYRMAKNCITRNNARPHLDLSIPSRRPSRSANYPGRKPRRCRLQLFRNVFLELDGVGGKNADAFAGFFRGHRVVVEQEAEFLFVQFE